MGQPNPDAMLAAMTPSQLGEWLAYYEIDPWGEQRADLRAAIVATEIHRAAGSRRSDGQPIEPKQFMRFIDQPQQKPVSQSEKLRAILKNLGSSKSAKTKRKG